MPALLPLLLLLLHLAAAHPAPGPPPPPALAAPIGPIAPDAHPATSLQEAVRRLRLSLDRELLLLARATSPSAAHQQQDGVLEPDSPADDDPGFSDQVNDGQMPFRPILPGTSVPPANMFTDEPAPPLDDSPAPQTPLPVPEVPIVSPAAPPDVPVVSPAAQPNIPDVPGATPAPVDDVPVVTPAPDDGPFPAPTDDLVTDPPVPTRVPRPLPPGVLPAESPIVSEPPLEPTRTPLVTVEPTETPLPPLPVFPETPGPVPVESPAVDDILGGELMGEEFTEAPSPSPEESPAFFGDDTVSPSPTEEDGSVCFPADATVQLDTGVVKRMADLQLGESVRVGPDQFSQVFMFTHKLAYVKHRFVSIRTQSGHRLKLTKGHYLYVNGGLAAASTVRVGDELMLADHSVSTVSAVDQVVSRGLFNPQTVHGDIVVDGVRATTYTTAVESGMAHALLAPLRAAYSCVGWSLSAFDAGADRLANLVPSGSLIL